ncbi:MAG: DUF2341 domain-containing protein, partial [Candidatus Bathyarchaeota archaeon]|nr:DUF2341 domain-containing protein [Candidatus Bathyarchaeota archaeon]
GLFRKYVDPEPAHGAWGEEEGSGGSGGGDWLEGWTYRKSHFISNCTGAGSDYPIKLIVNYGSGSDSGDTVYLNNMCQSDFGDIRFTDDDQTTLLDYWLEDFTLSEIATFWVEVSDDLSVSNTTIYLYYGNSTVATTSNQLTAGVLSLKEHRINVAYGSSVSFSQVGGTELRIDSTASASYMNFGYVFFVVPADWINGTYLRWVWDGYFSHGVDLCVAHCRIYDGVYDRSSGADFVSCSPYPTAKGNGLLYQYNETVSGTWGSYTRDVLVDVDPSCDFVTVFFFLFDYWYDGTVRLDLDLVEVNVGSGGSGNLVTVDFDVGSVVYDVTGTWNDYGLFRKYVDPEPAHGAWGEQEEPRTWLDGWDYRKSHTITSGDGAGVDYQFKLNVHYSNGTDNDVDVYLDSKCQPDFDDIRFTDGDGETVLDYWMQYKINSDTAIFWVEVADDLSSSNATIYLYYGNSEANSTSNGTNTFIFFEDFEDTLDNWNSTGTTAISSDHVYEGSNGFKGGIDPSFIRLDSLGYTNVSVHTFYWDQQSGGHETQGLLPCGTSEIAAIQVHENVSTTHYVYRVGSTYYISNVSRTNDWHEFCVRVSNNTREYVIDGEVQSITGTQNSINSITLGSWWTANSAESYFDVCFVRKYVASEPAHMIWGAEESK